jgi:hypothetical protein
MSAFRSEGERLNDRNGRIPLKNTAIAARLPC